MTLDERISDTKQRIDTAAQQHRQLQAHLEQSARNLIGLDAEMALLERMKAEDVKPALALVPPVEEAVS